MNEASNNVAGSVRLELDYSPTVNFAMQQNDVPMIRRIRVTNSGPAALTDLRVQVTGEPDLFPAWETSVAGVAAGTTYTLDTVDLRLDPAQLAGLAERVAGALRAELFQAGARIAEVRHPFEMLAFDEWNGLAHALPELMAAFVLPNHPQVESVLAHAAKWLGDHTGDRSLSGYQSKSPARVAQIAQAIYLALQARRLTYCNPPASFESTGQKIRIADRVFEHGLATCLDLAVLMAACFEQAGLNPLVILVEGHAVAGVWLIDESFPDCGTDEALPLRKRVELKELLVLETVLLTAPPPNDFATALKAGNRHLAEDDGFRCAIDIRRCRKSRIRPLPMRSQTAVDDAAARQAAEDAVPAAPVIDFAPIPETVPAAETPETRLDRWKRKLLDLSLHNRLLNFRESKKTVALLCPDLATLEDALADGQEFKLLARPAEFAEGGARSSAIHLARTGDDALTELLTEELASRRLHAPLSEQELQGRLTEMFRASRTALEEGGASALYLALGFLGWYESDSSEQLRAAPIMLIPVELRRNSVQDGFRLVQSDEEARINITLLEMLTKDFDLRIPSMDPIPSDEHGIDVAGVLTAFRRAVKDTKRWRVLEDAQLGFFSFTKFLMWRDLEKRTADLLKNKIVNHLVHHATEPFPDDCDFPAEYRLDDEFPPEQTYCPLPSDASQLAAVYSAATPRSFVLFGPPGTGKSQTITNLIAHSLATGKSVLFVSEKLAALSVVHDRLSKVGLGPFCLELHSSKANKRGVIDQLAQALDHRAQRSSDEWTREAQRLGAVRNSLNAYVRALHLPRRIGESVFQATSRLIGLRDTVPIDLKISAPQEVSREQLDRWHALIEQVRSAGSACGHPASSAWANCGIAAWSPAIQRALESDFGKLNAACERLEAIVVRLAPELCLPSTWNLSYLEFAEQLVKLLATSPRPTAALLLDADWNQSETAITAWLELGRRRDELRQTIFARYHDSILTLDTPALSRRLAQAMKRWWIPRWLGVRSVRSALAAVLRERAKLSPDQLVSDLATAQSLRDEESRVRAGDDRARELLGASWRDGEAEWGAIEQVRDWCRQFRKLAQTAAGTNLEKAAALRSHWARLVTEAPDSLRPDGAHGRLFAEFSAAHAEFVELKRRVEAVLVSDGSIWAAQPRRATPADVRKRVAAFQSAISELRTWCNWQRVRAEAVATGLLPLITTFELSEMPADALRDTFDRSFYQLWMEDAVEREPVLSQFFSLEFERQLAEFRAIDERYTRLTQAEIQARLAARRPIASDRVNQNSELGILHRQRQLRRGHVPPRQLFQRIPNLLHQLKPCVLMSPISVAQYLDAGHPAFDLVVFDEASQVPTWDAVGAIARGAEVVIVGDPKQLPPTNFFMRTDGDDEPTEDGQVEEMESILDECLSSQLPQMNLRWHYRSRHESLIAFSNLRYYDNALFTFPSPEIAQGVRYRHVPDGLYDKGGSRTNRAEATAVVAEIVRRLTHPELDRQSIGVVTFSVAQQTLIEDLLDKARREHPEIERYFASDADEPVFVKNLENVQGDERDVILLSVCYGPHVAGRPPSMNFGPLNRDGGERRLNVAVTRARMEIGVFATLKAEQIDLSRSRARGVQDLKLFLDYAERGPIAIAQAHALHSGMEFDSPFERAVCQQLRARGHTVHTQVGCSGYRIDLAVIDPDRPGRYLLGIECDGANYHSAKSARDRDRLRQTVLEGLGWRLHRVWSSDWWNDPAGCLTKVEAALAAARSAPVSSPAVESPVSSTEVESQSVDDCEADPAPPPSQPNTEPTQPQYTAFRRPGPRCRADDFYEPAADAAIRSLAMDVVAHEGPIALDVLNRRIAAHWGIARVGSVIRERIERLVRQTPIQWTTEGESVFLWPADIRPDEFAAFRVPGPGEEDARSIDEIPHAEIIAASTHVLQRQVSLPRGDLIRETALLLGFQRTGVTIQRWVGQAIESAVADGRLREANERLTLNLVRE